MPNKCLWSKNQTIFLKKGQKPLKGNIKLSAKKIEASDEKHKVFFLNKVKCFLGKVLMTTQMIVSKLRALSFSRIDGVGLSSG